MKGWCSVGAATIALVLGGAPRVRAQDTTFKEGVRIGLAYSPGTKPGLLVLPVNGASGDTLHAMLQRDFDNSDRFNVIETEGSGLDSSSTTPSRGQYNYALYQKLGALVMLQATMTSSGLHIAVHNVAQKKVERVRDFLLEGAALSPEWRLSVHVVADEIESWITGARGISATRLLYVSGGRIWQLDSDGANPTAITPAGSAMSPVWNPKATHIAYMTMGNTGSQIVVREIGGATRVISATPGGMNITPAFSPDSYTLIYSHGAENGADLYAVNAFGNDPARRVTVGRGSDNMSPTFSPDGRRIAFTSNRAGHAEVYISDADGTNAELLTPFNYGDQSYRSNPDWSPDGRLIAFQSQIDGRFQLMTINLRDKSIKRHTSEGINEDPSWAPDSRHLVFTSNRSGISQLWVLDTESARTRQLTRGSARARLAAWSPSLRPK